MKRGYSSEKYLYLFDNTVGQQLNFEDIRNRDVFRYRVKTIDAGPVRELEIYPLWNTRNEIRMAKKETREAQQKLNERNARKKLSRLINTNFTDRDIVVTPTYNSQYVSLPSEDQALADVRFYLRKVREYRQAHGLDDLKYIYVTEHAEENSKKTRIHHHIIMSGMDRNDAELIWDYVMLSGRFKPQAKKLWKYLLTPHAERTGPAPEHPFSGWVNSRRLQPDEYGFEKLANYLAKDPKGSKRWGASRNLKQYTRLSYSDHKISKRKAEQLAMDIDSEGRELLESMFPDYQFTASEIRRSTIVAGVYIYLKMHKAKALCRGNPTKKPRSARDE